MSSSLNLKTRVPPSSVLASTTPASFGAPALDGADGDAVSVAPAPGAEGPASAAEGDFRGAGRAVACVLEGAGDGFGPCASAACAAATPIADASATARRRVLGRYPSFIPPVYRDPVCHPNDERRGLPRERRIGGRTGHKHRGARQGAYPPCTVKGLHGIRPPCARQRGAIFATPRAPDVPAALCARGTRQSPG
jgi:hypothetical protein